MTGARITVWRWASRIAAASIAMVALAVAAVWMTGLGAVSHVDPMETPARWTPNWALAAPEGAATRAAPTLRSPVWAAGPEAALAALDAAALAEPRTEILAPPEGAPGAGDPLRRDYRQRSAIVGYPDDISARAVDLSAGGAPRASLILYSRSVYGYSDSGVNQARLRRWLAAVEARLAR